MDQIGGKVRKQWGLKNLKKTVTFLDADANAYRRRKG